jgi:flagellar protein FliL
MADAATTEARAEERKSAAAKRGGEGSKVVPILLAVNSVLLAAVVVMLVVDPGARHGASGEKGDEHATADAKGKAERAKERQPGPTVRLQDFVVHLRDADADRYARVAFELELADERTKDVVSARMPQIRDAFLAYLSDRTTDDLRGSEAMGRIKAALLQKIGEVAPGAPVRGLYIADLVVQ